MGKIQIMTDSASDISYADEQRYSISVIPFPITLGDKSYTSRVDFDNEQFFDLMAQYDEIPKTAQITSRQATALFLRRLHTACTMAAGIAAVRHTIPGILPVTGIRITTSHRLRCISSTVSRAGRPRSRRS